MEVELPQSRDDAFDLLSTIHRLAVDDPSTWRTTVRAYTACDWYMLMLFLSGSQRIDPFTGRSEVDSEFQFQYAREKQFDGDGVVDKTARGHWKSTWDTYVGVINYILNDPEISIALFAFEKAAAEKHGRRVKDELATNVELKSAWDDVLFQTPDQESPLWNQEKGIIVRRRIVSPSPTLSWYSIADLPTGLRISIGIFDDIETESTVSSEQARATLKARVDSAFNLAGRACRWRIEGTHHHSAGWIADLESSGAWRMRCHAAEDTTLPAPDIAALYDECGGMLPIREESGRPIPLPIEVRSVRLDGAPVFLHPLELAHKRLQVGTSVYYQQYMGDALAGQQRRMDPEWIRYYDIPPVEWAEGGFGYILIDPSKGVGDPTFARVEVTKSDQTISWVGGLRRKLTPSEFAPAIYQLAMEWFKVVRLVEIRVEEFAQSVWSHLLREYFDTKRHHVCPIIACSRHNTINKESSGRQREWAGLEPMYRMGRRLFPSDGIWVTDERNDRFNLVDYYVKKEYSLFPLPITDDGLAADFLLAATKGKNEGGKEINLALSYPESDYEWEDEDARWNRRGRKSGFSDDDGSTWMSEGF